VKRRRLEQGAQADHFGTEPALGLVRPVDLDDGREETRQFEVREKQYTEQRLTIDNPRMVNPDPQDLARIRSESASMRERYQRFGELTDSPLPFIQPVAGPLSSSLLTK